MDDVKIVHQQSSDRHGHPAVLVAMVVHRTGLPNFPTDSHQLVQRSLVDQIARVVLAIPGEIRRKRLGVDRGFLKESAELLRLIEGRLGKFAKLGYEIIDWNLVNRSGHRLLPKKYNPPGKKSSPQRTSFGIVWPRSDDSAKPNHSMNMQSP